MAEIFREGAISVSWSNKWKLSGEGASCTAI